MFLKNNASVSLLSQHLMGVPNVALGQRIMGHCMGLVGVIPLVVSRGKAPKAPACLRYLKPENS